MIRQRIEWGGLVLKTHSETRNEDTSVLEVVPAAQQQMSGVRELVSLGKDNL